jgi:hypothetical protein
MVVDTTWQWSFSAELFPMPTSHNLWYTRRGEHIRGPFPHGLITRFIVLGRLQMADEISVDQIRWQAVKDFPELIPDPLKSDPSDPELQEYLRVARRREDERAAGDRRQREGASHDERRAVDDRRQDELEEFLRHREVKTNLIKERQASPEGMRLRFIFALAGIVAGAIVAAFQFMPKAPALRLECDAPAGPQVNWSNCKFEGILLNGVELAGARMGNANLSGAQLQGANLAGSNLSYANFGRADLSRANLMQAQLIGMVLRNANLDQANLAGANLSYAILQGANLSRADLSNADLSSANLSGATLDGAKLDNTNLVSAIWTDRGVCGAGSIGKCVK